MCWGGERERKALSVRREEAGPIGGMEERGWEVNSGKGRRQQEEGISGV